jgi:hypothetical protein
MSNIETARFFVYPSFLMLTVAFSVIGLLIGSEPLMFASTLAGLYAMGGTIRRPY